MHLRQRKRPGNILHLGDACAGGIRYTLEASRVVKSIGVGKTRSCSAMTAVKMLYEGSREPSRADVFYEALCTVFQPNFRAHGLIVYGRSRPDAGAEWGAATLHFQRGLDDELVHQFCEHYHLKNVWAANEPVDR